MQVRRSVVLSRELPEQLPNARSQVASDRGPPSDINFIEFLLFPCFTPACLLACAVLFFF